MMLQRFTRAGYSGDSQILRTDGTTQLKTISMRTPRWLRKLSDFIAGVRWGTLDDRRKQGLVRLYDVLATTRLHGRYWMNGGLLLGCIRNGGPLPHDNDADFSFWKEDMEVFLEAMEKLKKAGFSEISLKSNKDGSKTQWGYRFRAVKFEFYQMERANGKMRWYSHARRKNTIELVNEVPIHGLNEIELYGRRWMKPDDHEKYLESLYGNWRVPDPNYCYWKDSRAVVDRYPWAAA
jgi:phosphorylcholine metabolism protein LicD